MTRERADAMSRYDAPSPVDASSIDSPSHTTHDPSRLHVQGEGPPLLYVPGLDGTGLLFYRQTRVLSHRFRVITYRLRDEAEEMETLVAELPEPTSLVPIPDALVELEARHEMLQILKTLPPRQRQVLFLTLQSFTPMEIAEQLELEPATIRAHLMRARRAAAAQLKEGEKEQ